MLAENPGIYGQNAGYVRNEVAGDSKKASFSFTIDSGKYNLSITSDNSGTAVASDSIVIPDKDDYKALINALKSSDKTAFLNYIKIEDNRVHETAAYYYIFQLK